MLPLVLENAATGVVDRPVSETTAEEMFTVCFGEVSEQSQTDNGGTGTEYGIPVEMSAARNESGVPTERRPTETGDGAAVIDADHGMIGNVAKF